MQQEKLKQLEEKLNVYYQNHPELEKPNFYCKDCGKFLIYDDGNIHFNERNNKNDKHDIISWGKTFLSVKQYNGHIYHLCRCKECVGKKFPQIYSRKNLYCVNFAKYTQYAYGVSNEDFFTYTHIRQAITKDNMIKKYGEELGLEKWNSYCQKQSITNTFEYKREKYGMTKEEFKEYNKSRACTKELFIKRHGYEEGLKRWSEYCERQRYTNSKEYFIKEYGEEKGLEKYINFAKSRAEQYSTSFSSVSKISLELFNNIIKYFINNEIYFNKNEYEIILNTGDVYHLDYYDKTLNVIIEFYGDFWHYNPLIYNENDINVYNKHLYDKQRIEKIQKELKSRIIIVWEHTYYNNKQKTIDKIIDIINNKNIKYIEINGD